MPRSLVIRALVMALALSPLLLLAAGCAHKPLYRALPREVDAVYVPIFKSWAYEPGLEELVTRATIDEFLIDGRVRVTPKPQADLILRGHLREMTTTTESLQDDGFALLTKFKAVARVTAYGPDDPEERNPLFIWDNIESELVGVTDKRFTIDTLDVDSRRQLMESLGKAVVDAVITTEPTWAFDVAEGELPPSLTTEPTERYRTAESLRDRRMRRRGLPPVRPAF